MDFSYTLGMETGYEGSSASLPGLLEETQQEKEENWLNGFLGIVHDHHNQEQLHNFSLPIELDRIMFRSFPSTAVEQLANLEQEVGSALDSFSTGSVKEKFTLNSSLQRNDDRLNVDARGRAQDQPLKQVEKAIEKSTVEKRRVFRCSEPNCTKTYTSRNGFKYHKNKHIAQLQAQPIESTPTVVTSQPKPINEITNARPVKQQNKQPLQSTVVTTSSQPKLIHIITIDDDDIITID